MTSQQNEAHQKAGRRPFHGVDEPARTIRCGTTPELRGVWNHDAIDHAPENREWMRSLPQGFSGDSVTTRRLHPDRPACTITSSVRAPPIHYADDLPVEVAESPSTTVLARGYLRRGGHHVSISDGDIRRLTVREAARLQSFPDWFVFSGSKTEQLRQVGNAVPPRLQQHMTAAVVDIINLL